MLMMMYDMTFRMMITIRNMKMMTMMIKKLRKLKMMTMTKREMKKMMMIDDFDGSENHEENGHVGDKVDYAASNNEDNCHLFDWTGSRSPGGEPGITTSPSSSSVLHSFKRAAASRFRKQFYSEMSTGVHARFNS